MTDRRRRTIGVRAEPCDVCGHAPVDVVRSREVRSGMARLDPRWDGKPSTYGLCSSCGARFPAGR